MSRRLPTDEELRLRLLAINKLLVPILHEFRDVVEDSYTSTRGTNPAEAAGPNLNAGQVFSDPTADTVLNGRNARRRAVCRSVWHDVQVAEALLASSLASLKHSWREMDNDTIDLSKTCRHCGREVPEPLRRGLCGADYTHWYRHGELPNLDQLKRVRKWS